MSNEERKREFERDLALERFNTAVGAAHELIGVLDRLKSLREKVPITPPPTPYEKRRIRRLRDRKRELERVADYCRERNFSDLAMLCELEIRLIERRLEWYEER